MFCKSFKDFLDASEKLKLAHLRPCIEPSLLGKLDLIPELNSVQKMMKAITDQADKVHPKIIRRNNFASSKQTSNQSFSEYTEHIKNLQVSADVKYIDSEQVFVWMQGQCPEAEAVGTKPPVTNLSNRRQNLSLKAGRGRTLRHTPSSSLHF